MTDFFKHNNGYISFDEGHIYLTNSCDCNEISKLTEKNDDLVNHNLKRTGRIKNAAIAFFIFFTCIIFLFNDTSTSIALTAVLAAIAYGITNYFKPRYHYKIPFSKIDSIANSGKGIKINFRNEKNEPESEIIDNIEYKGLKALIDLKLVNPQNSFFANLFFKHRNGYINVDEENLYFTSSGFWKDAKSTKEKKKPRRNLSPKTEYIFYVSKTPLQFIFFAILIWSDFPDMEKILYIALPYIIILLTPYHILNIETDFKYKIPLSKIESVEQKNGLIKINFRLADNVTKDTIVIDKVSDKGIGILSELNFIPVKT